MIDLGTDDPEVAGNLEKALHIIHEQIGELKQSDSLDEPLPYTSEIYRLQKETGSPLSINALLRVALHSSSTALQQIADSISNQRATTHIALQSLMRVALLGTSRAALVLLPKDPKQRLDNAKLVLAQDCQSGLRALETFKDFQVMQAMVPPPELIDNLRQQKDLLDPKQKLPGEGAIITRYTEAFIQAAQFKNRDDAATMHDHARWIWHTYSGLAHANSWPSSLLPGISPDNPGDFPLDLYMTANSCVVALSAYLSRSESGSANTDKNVNLSRKLP